MESPIPFLMFCGEHLGQAEEAVRTWCTIFDDAEVTSIELQDDGTVRMADLRIGSQRFRAIDNDGPHGFSFTPAISLWIECSSTEEVERLATALAADGGQFLMPPGDYGFSTWFAWVADRFGVTWQLNLQA
jgi:predicted 3-demethylubiquinone-9 3-methyltransferase (glyoxalase superfamily)